MSIKEQAMRLFCNHHIDEGRAIVFHLKDGNIIEPDSIQGIYDCSVEVWFQRREQVMLIDKDFIAMVETRPFEVIQTED